MTLALWDRVVFETLPAWVDRLRQESQRVFRFCVGRSFQILEIDSNGLVVLDVSHDVDRVFGGSMNDIRVEPKYLRRAD